jgi:hypothetical protein
VNDLGKIISQLEHQRTAIDRAISALREIGGEVQTQHVTRAAKAKTAVKRHLSPEGRRRIVEATKRRWAAKRAADALQRSPAKKAAAKRSA